MRYYPGNCGKRPFRRCIKVELNLYRYVMKPRIIAIALLASLLQACILYVPDVEQGNILTKDMIDKVKVGQSEQQVRFLLGSPLVQDVFHQDRWDYVYTMKKGRSKKVDQKRLTIIFDNGVVTKIVQKS